MVVQIPLNGAKPSATAYDVANAICDRFIADSSSNVWQGNTANTFCLLNSSNYLRFTDGTGSMTVDAWKSWLASNPTTVLYPLATPTTEEMGYVNLPDIPDGAVVSMPELEGLGVESWTGDAVARYVRAWAARQ
jgi:hypothetical protein